jgi:hypothetical protein
MSPAFACTGYDMATGPSNQTRTALPSAMSDIRAALGAAFAPGSRQRCVLVVMRTDALALPDCSCGRSSTRIVERSSETCVTVPVMSGSRVGSDALAHAAATTSESASSTRISTS